MLSRKELIKQEYNLLLETRLPNIMQLMNSEKSHGLGIAFNADKLGSASPFDIAGGLKDSRKKVGVSSAEKLVEERTRSQDTKNFTNRAHSINVKHFEGKQSVDYDDTEFLQKMFSNCDSDIRNLAKPV